MCNVLVFTWIFSLSHQAQICTHYLHISLPSTKADSALFISASNTTPGPPSSLSQFYNNTDQKVPGTPLQQQHKSPLIALTSGGLAPTSGGVSGSYILHSLAPMRDEMTAASGSDILTTSQRFVVEGDSFFEWIFVLNEHLKGIRTGCEFIGTSKRQVVCVHCFRLVDGVTKIWKPQSV